MTNNMTNVCMILLLNDFLKISEFLNLIENSGCYILVYLDFLQSRMIPKLCSEDLHSLLGKQL